MNTPRFLQIHTLTSYPGTLLNRDDAGFAKRLPFGGATRTRVSSQCLKRHWRTFAGEHSLAEIDVPRSIRSRETFKRRVANPLVSSGLPEPLTHAVVKLIIDDVVGKSAARGDEETALHTSQITVLGEPEVQYMRQVARDFIEEVRDDFEERFGEDVEDKKADKDLGKVWKKSKGKDLKKNLAGLNLATGLDAALFGRMATSDILARGDAAVHVAHAITVHEEASESDYFSAVDDLVAEEGDGELGAGHINSTELTSGLFYGYVVVDVPLLVSNLEGVPAEEWQEADRTLAAKVAERLIHIITRVSPGAKLGSTAPYAHSQCVLVEWGSTQPRTLANAFQRPVRERPDVLANAYDALGRHISELDGMYGHATERRLSGIGPVDRLFEPVGVEQTVPVADAASWVADRIQE